MNLNEAKTILEENGYLVEKRFGNVKDIFSHRNKRLKLSDISTDDRPITVENIDANNYKDYIGKFVNVTCNVWLNDLGLEKLPIKFGKVGGDFDCSNNNLTSLEGAPYRVGCEFYCTDNKKKFTEHDVKKVCKVYGYIFV